MVAAPWRAACTLAGALGLGGGAAAEIVTDGTAGPALELAGPEFAIGADLGTRAGDNLFHSFERFSVAAGERATFSSPDPVDNVIARVTGGAPSEIDGTLRSTIPGADLYFVNPAGVLFGPDASLDVMGSFHASTADELRFANGDVLGARDLDASSFSVAAPEAFGFLGSEPAALAVDRSALAVPPGETLSLSGGALTVTGDPAAVEIAPDGSLLFGKFLLASDGRIVLAALGEGGTLVPASGATSGAAGSIVIEDAGFVGTRGGANSGTIIAAGGDLTIDRSLLTAANFSPGADATGGIALQAAGELRLTDSLVQTGTGGTGRAGSIAVEAGRLVLDGAQLDASTFGLGPSGTVRIDTTAPIEISGQPEGLLFPATFFRAGVFANGRGSGGGGRIEIDAPGLSMADGSNIDAGTYGDASAGSVGLAVDRVRLRGGGRILAGTEAAGDAGAIEITGAREVSVSGRDELHGSPGLERSGIYAGSGYFSQFATQSQATGDAGRIHIDADHLDVRQGARINAGTWQLAGGASGGIDVDVRRLDIRSGGQISNSSSSESAEPGGALIIHADERIAVTWSPAAAPDDFRSGVFSDAAGGVAAGNIVLVTSELIIDGGRVTSDTISDADAGVIRIGAPAGANVDLVIRNEGQIFAGTDAGGDGADIVLEDGGTIEITGTSNAALAAPDVNPTSPTGIFSNVKRDGRGDGGDIRIAADRLVMRQGAAISSQTLGEGAAGAIEITLAGPATIDDSVVETAVAAVSDAPTAGGQIAIRSGRLIDLDRARITTNGVIPAPGSSILTLAAPIVAINRSTVTSLTAAGEPLPGVRSGVVAISGEPVLISSDSLVAATSSLELSGVDEELGTKLIALPVTFLDASGLLRERCAARRDVGASSFTGVGRGGLPASPDQPLGSAYRPPAAPPAEAGTPVRPAAMTLVIPCSGML